MEVAATVKIANAIVIALIDGSWLTWFAHAGTALQPWWPGLTALGFVVGLSWKYALRLKAWLHIGVSHVNLAAKINAQADSIASLSSNLAESERARASLRAILADLRSSLDVEEVNLASLREKLTLAERMLETHSLNELALFSDRAALVGWGDALAAQVRRLGGKPDPMPTLSGSEVAEISDYDFARNSEVTRMKPD